MLEGRLDRLLPLVYQFNQKSDEWLSLSRELLEYLNATAVALTYHNFSDQHGFIYTATGYDPHLVEVYATDYSHQNVWLTEEREYRPPGKIHLGEQLVPEKKLVTTKFYTGWLQPQNLHHRLCAVLSRDRGTAVLLEVMRPQGRTRFNESDIEACRLIVPHLQHLMQVHHRIAELEKERDAALHALDYMPWGVILVDNHGHQLAANRRAQEIVLAREGLMVRGDSLRAVLADESARLERLLYSALKGTGHDAGGTVSITRPLKAHPLSVVVIPLRPSSDSLAHRVPAAAIFMSDPDMQVDGNEQHLRELYALTAVEARLATRLTQGKSIDEAATEMGVTVNTARAYLKRIYSKTGVRRQSELMRRLLLGLAGLSQRPERTTR